MATPAEPYKIRRYGTNIYKHAAKLRMRRAKMRKQFAKSPTARNSSTGVTKTISISDWTAWQLVQEARKMLGYVLWRVDGRYNYRKSGPPLQWKDAKIGFRRAHKLLLLAIDYARGEYPTILDPKSIPQCLDCNKYPALWRLNVPYCVQCTDARLGDQATTSAATTFDLDLRPIEHRYQAALKRILDTTIDRRTKLIATRALGPAKR